MKLLKWLFLTFFCIKIQFYYSKIIHTLFMHKNKNANVTTKSRMWHWHFEITSIRMTDKIFSVTSNECKLTLFASGIIIFIENI